MANQQLKAKYEEINRKIQIKKEELDETIKQMVQEENKRDNNEPYNAGLIEELKNEAGKLYDEINDLENDDIFLQYDPQGNWTISDFNMGGDEEETEKEEGETEEEEPECIDCGEILETYEEKSAGICNKCSGEKPTCWECGEILEQEIEINQGICLDCIEEANEEEENEAEEETEEAECSECGNTLDTAEEIEAGICQKCQKEWN